jgi:hypothetical protein
MRWKSSADQIAIVIDCASGRISLESAAGLLRLRPATLETILREIEAVRARRAASRAVDEHS